MPPKTPNVSGPPPKAHKTAAGFVGALGSSRTAHGVPEQMFKTVTKKNLFFRGDGRLPKEIFQNGFSPRIKTGVVYRTMDQDIDPQTAVCISPSLDVAALFPIQSAVSDRELELGIHRPPIATVVYIVRANEVFNTESIQRKFANREVQGQSGKQRNAALNNIFARERATKEILAEDVVAAIHVTRLWNGQNYSDGGKYTVTDIELNPNSSPDFKKFVAGLKASWDKREFEKTFHASCKLAVAKDVWEDVLDDEEGYFKNDELLTERENLIAANAASNAGAGAAQAGSQEEEKKGD